MLALFSFLNLIAAVFVEAYAFRGRGISRPLPWPPYGRTHLVSLHNHNQGTPS
jgi:hypothetical protein